MNNVMKGLVENLYPGELDKIAKKHKIKKEMKEEMKSKIDAAEEAQEAAEEKAEGEEGCDESGHCKESSLIYKLANKI